MGLPTVVTIYRWSFKTGCTARMSNVHTPGAHVWWGLLSFVVRLSLRPLCPALTPCTRYSPPSPHVQGTAAVPHPHPMY